MLTIGQERRVNYSTVENSKNVLQQKKGKYSIVDKSQYSREELTIAYQTKLTTGQQKK